MTLSQKESTLLKDLKGQERLCVEKYEKYASQACAQELKTLFGALAQVERGHLNTVTELLGGKIPSVSSSAPSPLASCSTGKVSYATESDRSQDAFLCSDMLATEKHVSSVYDTGIFEFADPQARGVLNHIQAEEQQHGLKLYDYMSANGMYQ